MTPTVSSTARQTWARLEGRDFNAVDDLIASLEDADPDRLWAHLDVVGEFDASGVTVRVTRSATSLLMMIDATRLEIFAIGRPGL